METEIICISSDDELDLQKKDRKDSAINSTKINNKQFKNSLNCYRKNNEKAEGNLKRKVSQITDLQTTILYNNVEKKKKLKTQSSQDTIETLEKKDIVRYNILKIREDKILEKPKLIVKERKSISYIAHDIFPLFISLCLHKSQDDDMKKIVSKLKRHYEQLDPSYASSESFVSFLNQKREDIMNDNMRLYVHISEVMNEMKSRARKKPPTLSSNETFDAVPSTSYATNNLSTNNATESDYADDENINNSKSRETKKKMTKLLKAMKKCELVIKKLEEAEVDFDDESDSSYMKVERYKQRMVELYNKFCELTGEHADAGRAYLRPKHICPTRIVAVDQAITNFINTKILQRHQSKKSGVFTDDLIFPDYTDILQCVNRCNNKKNLGLSERKQEEMAKKAFVELGELLQRARRNDYWDTFSLYLENTAEDPALKDKNLAKKLSDNRSEGEKKLTAIFEKYAKKQELKEQAVNEDKISEEEDEDNVDNDNESIKSVEEDLSATIEEMDGFCDADNAKNILHYLGIDETVKENKSPIGEKNDNTSIENADQSLDKIILNKSKTNTLQEKCERKDTKDIMKENNAAISEEKNKNVESNSIIDNNIITTKKIVDTETQLQKEASSTFSTTVCTNATNRAEENVADVLANLVQITEDAAEVIKKDVTETKTEADIVTENAMHDQQLEEEKKPLLRVRSFAKPPTTWEDGRHKIDKTTQNNVTNVVTKESIIDLTDETPKSTSLNTKYAIKIGDKILPVKPRRQTLFIPSGNIISVQNITNNYVKVNPHLGQVIGPADRPTKIHTPIAQTTRQNQSQTVNTATKNNIKPLSKNQEETILQIIRTKSFLTKKVNTITVGPKQIDMPSSTAKSK